MKQVSIISVILISFLLLLSACSSDEKSDKNNDWETYSANANKEKSGIDYSRPEDSTASSEEIEKDVLKPNDGNNPDRNSEVGNKMFKEYGAVFSTKNGAIPPNKVVFNNESEVTAWQSSVAKSRESINGITVELQKPAMDALVRAVDEAKHQNLSITPRGTDAAKRNYDGTVRLWKSRVNPGLDFWVKKGRLQKEEAERIRVLPVSMQIPEIFKLEDQGMYFSKDNSKSIIYSVAPPGTSQHISMLALDVSEHDNPQVQEILGKHGWFQTVISDTPHFTYLGVKKEQLSQIGLKQVSNGGRSYWIPNK